MRLFCLIPCLALAGCGDNKANSPDGNHSIDAAPDTMIDAPVDMGHMGDGTRVWAIGDLITDTQLIATSFADGDTLPFGPTNPPPLIVPAGGHIQPKNTNTAFDTNGHKIAFIADATTAGQFDLLVADTDGTNPVTLVQGTGFTIQSVALSPDGTKVAYTADSAAIVGGFDLYVVDTTGSGTPVKVSPDRGATATTPANNDVLTPVTWSADSKFLGFVGDLNVDKANQAWAVDTTQTTPTAVELLSTADIATGTGVSGALSFDAQDRVFFSARIGTNTSQFQLFKINNDGTGKQINPAFIPMRGDNSAPDIGALAISPDGKTIVFGADAPTATAYNLYAVTFGVGTPVALTNLTAVTGISLHSSFSAPLWFSPDGKSVATVANFKATGTSNSPRQEPFVAKLDGSDTHRLVDVIDTCTGACDASQLQWTKDSATIYLLGDVTLNNDAKIYRLDPGMTDQTPTLAIDVTTGVGDFIQVVAR
jgi:Tol biopolymer transport system component